ncbi:orotate phosphoribosyltransferase [Anaplasmataceae bacterium AB001_6]|nr:orotate phosphoribosyltransferase [Anaplasmataceae bacterium AB001_6]
MIDIEKIFFDKKAILKGHFVLSSGMHSEYYFQCAKILEDTKIAQQVISILVEKIQQYSLEKFGKKINEIADAVASPAIGGVVVGYELARALGLNFIFCERVDGSFVFRRGFSTADYSKIIIMEDVITTTKSALETMKLFDNTSAEVVLASCLVDRSNGKAAELLPCDLLSLMEFYRPIYDASKLPEHLEKEKAILLGSNKKNITDGVQRK